MDRPKGLAEEIAARLPKQKPLKRPGCGKVARHPVGEVLYQKKKGSHRVRCRLQVYPLVVKRGEKDGQSANSGLSQPQGKLDLRWEVKEKKPTPESL